MNTQEIEDKIISTIYAIQKQFTGDTKGDTNAVLLAFGRLGDELGYGVCGLRDRFESAWLFDLCWYSNASDNRLLNLTLVLESEWSVAYEDIKFDFEKLLIAKAKFKVFVFQAKSSNVVSYLNELEKGIHIYQGGSAGEIYLLACYDYMTDEFEIRSVAGV